MQGRGWVALFGAALLLVAMAAAPLSAAPYAAMVIDARDGKVLHSRNADTRLHPASLTKMMTLYVAFEAVRNGEITLDTKVKVSRNAASEPPSKIWLKPGQRIALRYLIRAAAVRSANDAATAIGEAISGSEAAFAERMTRTARAMGMSKTTFKNAHGLTQSGHLSTARDMTTLGRHLFYDYPEYYNLFSRRTAHAGITEVANTNRRFLAAYRGADGIKTGYTSAAGFNLVASAERGNERIIATMFGGSSTAARNKRVAELLDMGFQRAPSRVAERRPARPGYSGNGRVAQATAAVVAIASSARPMPRPVPAAETVLAAADPGLTEVTANATAAAVAAASTAALPQGGRPATGAVDPETIAGAVATAAIIPAPRPDETGPAAAGPEPGATQVAALAAGASGVAGASAFAAAVSPPPEPRPVVITFSSSDSTLPPAQTVTPAPVAVTRGAGGGALWAIDVGLYGSRYEAERVLLKTALLEVETLDDARRQVERRPAGFAAIFSGLDERTASTACNRLQAREQDCTPISP